MCCSSDVCSSDLPRSRAMSDNPDLAQLSGIDTRLTTILTWTIIGVLSAAAGFFLGINTELKSLMGWYMLLPMFAATILGGVGRVAGAVRWAERRVGKTGGRQFGHRWSPGR